MTDKPHKGNISILIVDDEPMMRSLVERILQRDGYTLAMAENGSEANDRMKAQPFDIVISDVKMPVMNGFDLLRKVKTDFPRTVMIMMTAYGDTYTVKDALLLGADEYITKPFKSHEISLVVERAYWKILSDQHLIDPATPYPN